jgi:hypothetical protein
MTYSAKKSLVHTAVLMSGALLALSGAVPLLHKVLADDLPQVKISATGVAPRILEQATGESLVREYATAWKNLATSLDENRTDLLNDDFAGTAKDRLTEQIAAQKKNGLHQHTVDHGHQVDAVFYSTDGSAIELRDTAQLEIQVLDGGKIVASNEATVHYLAVLTVADGRWKVRELVAVPEFSK